ncbi:hypothetical protein [Nocardiopsis sp. CC223A]|uniref:hypothetical protein n=1 Tax=Nocardiopsis sp. CC223A TaxID=3044051 RepID=UPI00278C7DE8|nr:hypothetical protein [Nocardiopsis sp. CC223A]
MTPAITTARRLLGGTAVAVLAAALGLTLSAPPAATAATAVEPLVWGNAQAWAANGDAVSGYSAAVSFGGDNEEHGDTADVYGPLAPYIDIEGSSHTVIDSGGAAATAVVDSAVLRLTVADLVALGMVDVPTDVDIVPTAPASPDASPDASPEASPSAGDGEDPLAPYWDTPTPKDEEAPRPQQPPADEDRPRFEGESEGTDPASPSPEGSDPAGPSPSESPTDDVIALDDASTRRVAADNTLEISVADVTTTATAGYDGHTGTGFEHGTLSAFGVPVDPLRPGRAQVVEDVLEVMDEEGETVLEVPVAVHFARVQDSFDDEDPDWRGRGARSRLSVTVNVGDAEDGNGFAVDFADSWALGSTYAAGPGTSPTPDERTDTAPQAQQRSNNDLAMTGSSLAALVTAALVAIGGGSTATFLARKRTSAMDDRIGD